MVNSKSEIAGGQRVFFRVRSRPLCWNPPKWSFSLTARLTQTRLHSSLRCRALHGCGCLGAKFQEQRCRRRLTRFETMKFQFGISEFGISEGLEMEYQVIFKRELPRFNSCPVTCQQDASEFEQLVPDTSPSHLFPEFERRLATAGILPEHLNRCHITRFLSLRPPISVLVRY